MEVASGLGMGACSFVALEGIANFLKLSDISPYEFGIVYLFAH